MKKHKSNQNTPRVAVITGASSGIGREFARQLKSKNEADIFWLVARRADRLRELANELGTQTRLIVADLSCPDGIGLLRATLERDRPKVSWLVSAAGYGKFGRGDELSPADVSGMIDLNCKASVLITQMTLPYLCRGGHIIEMGSASCFTPLPNFNIYAAGKAFILHYTKALRFEIRHLGISATAFCPGWVDTGFLGIADGGREVHMPTEASRRPLLRPGRAVKGAIRAARHGRSLYVTNWYTKLQHLLSKFLPSDILTRQWLKMQNRK